MAEDQHWNKNKPNQFSKEIKIYMIILNKKMRQINFLQ